jgi:hypothetical protein
MQMSVRVPIWLIITVVGVCLDMEGRADEVFLARDTNADGVLSGREAKGLKGLDRDGDGEISESEFQMAIRSWREQVAAADDANFKMIDGNEDERLSGNETSNYEFCDLNGDSRISKKEFLQGLDQRRLQLAALPADQIQQSADEYFRTLDSNEDGRLTGTEIVGMARYDADADGRTSKDEWNLGNLMDALSAGSSSASVDGPGSTQSPMPRNAGNPLQLLADAANSQNADTLIANLRPELTGIVDDVILKYAVTFVHKHHGRIHAISKSDIQTKPNDNPDAVEYSASVKCDKDKLRLVATSYEGKLMGLQYDSPVISELDKELYADLSHSLGSDDGLARQFAAFYSPRCLQLINAVLTSNDDDAFAMVFPLVRDQIGREAFDGVFNIIREQCGPEPGIELESFLIEEDKDGSHMFKIGHRVTGENAPQILTVGFQIIGMQAAIVSFSIAPADAENSNADAKPTTLQQIIADAWNKLDDGAKSDSVADALKLIDASQDGLTFRMPGQPTREVVDDATIAWNLDGDDSSFAALIMSVDFDLEQKSALFLDQLGTMLVDRTKGKLTNVEAMNWKGHTGQSLLIDLPNGGRIYRRDVVIGKKCYSLQCSTDNTSDEFHANTVLPFLQSFKPTGTSLDAPDSSEAPTIAPPSEDVAAPPSPTVKPPVPAPPRLD